MKKVIIIIVLLVLVLGIWVFTNKRTSPEQTTVPFVASQSDQKQVEDIVIGFGAHFKNVALTADTEMLISTIQKEYGAFVTPELLDSFVTDPTHAPGRETSSPWPEKVEIKNIEKVTDGYSVNAEIVLMTSDEITNGGGAGRTSVFFMVINQNGKWRVSDYQLTTL